MRLMMSRFKIVATVTIALSVAAASARAETVAEFYKGRTITIVVGHQAGTGFDIYARVLARHMGRHIPAHPGMIVQNMLGASGITAANWLYAIAPKDGTALAAFVQTVPLDPLLGDGAGKFDPTRFTWIGNLERSVATCVVTAASGVKTFADLQKRETLFGATGGSGPLSQYAHAIKNLLGAKVRLVSGYQGAPAIGIAMQRGEVEGMCGATTSFLTSFWPDQMNSGQLKPVIQLNGGPHADLAGIAHAYPLAKSDEDRQVFDLIFGSLSLGRIYAGAPGIPSDRANALRAAFLATTKDPLFVADAVKTKIDISPMPGEEVALQFAAYAKLPPAVIARAKRAISAQ